MSTQLTLRRASSLHSQSCLEGVTPAERVALRAEAWGLVSSCLPLIVRRMDANTRLPGRGTAVETAFFNRFEATRYATYNTLPVPTRELQLAGLSLGYASAIDAAELLLGLVFCSRHDDKAQAFVLRVVDYMLPAARSLSEITLPAEIFFASTVEYALSGAVSLYDATLIASLRAKWKDTAMVQTRRERDLLDA